MSNDAPVPTAVCRINLLNQEHTVTQHDWPSNLLAASDEILEMESLLFQPGPREVLIHRRDGYARFILTQDFAELLVQDAPGPTPVRTLRYTCEGWFPRT
jgi:hypothetical protein